MIVSSILYSNNYIMTKNITNGEFDLDIDADDRVAENSKFSRVPGGDIFDTLRRYNPNI